MMNGKQFRSALLASIVLVFLSYADGAMAADDSTGKSCILKAAQLLNSLPGIRILKSNATMEPNTVGDNKQWRKVRIFFAAAGITDTYTFLCAVAPSGTFVQRISDK